MSSRPKRRAAAKAIDYSKEQEFSDAEDVFEDEADEPVPAAPKPRRSTGGTRRPRKSQAVVTSAAENDFGSSGYDGGSAYGSSFPGASSSYRQQSPAGQYYVEKGYDPTLPPLRERFTFEPEMEEDGSPKIDLIVGRRPIDDKEAQGDSDDDDDNERSPQSPSKASPSKSRSKRVDYEYLIKYKGRSYLHLEWKSASDLESMNKSAKSIYRRYIKKLQSSDDAAELEDAEVDQEFIRPERIVDEKEEEVMEEISDKELAEWEKQRDKEIEEEEAEEDDDKEEEPPSLENGDAVASVSAAANGEKPAEAVAENGEGQPAGRAESEEPELGEPGTVTVDQLREIINKDGPYYPKVEGSDNPYRDGYITEPPKKPRASYLFFQGVYRSVYQKKHPEKSLSEVMTLMGDAWRGLGEEGQAPFAQLAKEETAQFEYEKELLEKAQKATEVWQPIRRCEMVLNRLSEDGFSSIFQEPVDTDVFSDYLEYVEHPMDLSTVRAKLKETAWNRKYQAPENFARDMRKIWNNCKIYNQHGSAIWHVADYMSKQFERLYHAWVLDFRTRYLRWADPRARPWEHSCRKCDGKCNTPDDKMVLCDHCDANYGMECVRPPVSEAPQMWHCPDCAPKLIGEKGSRMLSAVSEYAARRRAELGDVPKRAVMKRLFLVKWAGLGYEQCSWETAEDIDDEHLIAEYRRLNNMTPDEPELMEDDVQKVLDNATGHICPENAGGSNIIPDLRSQLYSQTRASQFCKFGMDIPALLALECGPKTKSCGLGAIVAQRGHLVDEVASALTGIVDKISHHQARSTHLTSQHKKLAPCLTGEYDVVVPITSKGLLMNVGEMSGAVSFLGYRRFEDGSMGPAEKRRLIRSHGDRIIAVDGKSAINKSFKEVIAMLKESGKNSFAYMRLLDARYQACDGNLSSMGAKGALVYKDLNCRFKTERRRLLAQRAQEMIDEDDLAVDDGHESDESVGPPPESDSDSDSESGSENSEGEFEPDSEDEEIIKKHQSDSSPQQKGTPGSTTGTTPAPKDANEANGGAAKPKKEEKSRSPALNERVSVNCKQETTRSLAYRFLDVDIGYSSDEGGDEDCAHFIDGVDATFMTSLDIQDDKREHGKNDADTLPIKKNEFAALGERAKLVSAIAISSSGADPCDFDNYPKLSSKAVITKQREEEEKEKIAAELAKKKEEEDAIIQTQLAGTSPAPAKPVKLSKTKIEQVDTKTNEVIRVWAKAEDAAATLQLNLENIRQILRGEYSEELGDEVGGYRWRFAAADAEITKMASTDTGSKKGKQAFLEFRDKLYDHEKPHIYKNENKLRDYQIDGVNWLASCWYKRHSCILADEMGLGKTVQIVSYIEHIHRVEKINGPFLVVVPLSTVEHWRREFEGWTDLRCCVYHDRQRVWRDVMREYEWYYVDRPHTPDYLKFDVLVTTYDTLIGDFDVMGKIPWRVAVVDEAHRLRNLKGKLLECMKEISALGTLEYGYQSRVLMTGTPLQNNTQELWTLLNFIEPFKFPSLEEFEENYGDMNNRAQVESLQRKISPYMLRRVKEDVAKDIPAKEETLIDVELTAIQKQYYRAIFEHNHSFLSMGARNAAPKLMNIQMELRKCCNHPFLLDGVETREMENYHKESYESGAFDGKSADDVQDILNLHGYIQTSGKMVLLDKLLPKLRKEGHKVLIFSQMVKMLDLLSEYMEFRGFRHETLTGKVRGNERQKAIDRFNTEEDSFAFLLSTRAGGVGINLTAADICIIFDSDWNPQNDVQAQARCHRIGQTKDVRIYRLITSRTFEQEMFDRASKKLGLEQAVLGTFGQDDDDGKPTAKEMEQLLKKGAYALVDDDDEIGNEFCADDIESILAKRTRTRVVEGVKTASWLNKAGMNVTKSKFTGDSKAAGIDVDDPLFWQKVMPDFVTPTIMMEKLNELTEEVEDRPKGPGRGRKKKPEANGEDDEENQEDEEKETKSRKKAKKGKKDGLTKGAKKKINKFMGDLTSMMDDIFEKDEDDNLPQGEKALCQTLLLTISVKANLFTEEQRSVAKVLLKRLEGDRRRRCRTADDHRFVSTTGAPEEASGKEVVPEALLIRKSAKKKKRRRSDDGEDDEDDDEKQAPKKKRKKGKPVVGPDGYLEHSDSEGDWSDVGDSIYESTRNRGRISKKEAKRRKQWASDKDAASAAGRAWPSFPRSVVTNVLGMMLGEMIKYDRTKGGMFSEPVSREEFPEYFEIVKNPMDYSTMKAKLENGEYRSAQAMQKDFHLVMKNCLQFNAPESDIVDEARKQALLRPKLLKDAATKLNLFIAEDGSVLEMYDPDDEKSKKKKKKKPKKRFVRCKACDACQREDCGKCEACLDMVKFGGKGTKKFGSSCKDRKCENPQERPQKDVEDAAGAASIGDSVGSDSEDSVVNTGGRKDAAKTDGSAKKKSKPRVKISLSKTKKKEETNSDIYMDTHALQAEREALDGSYDASLANFKKRGPWKLPEQVVDKFTIVAMDALAKMGNHDSYDLFFEPVGEDEAPGYSDIVTKPMDFGTMKNKVQKGIYGDGSTAVAALYEDFLLCMENCALYNDVEGEVMEEATRLLSLLPEVYSSACVAAAGAKAVNSAEASNNAKTQKSSKKRKR